MNPPEREGKKARRMTSSRKKISTYRMDPILLILLPVPDQVPDGNSTSNQSKDTRRPWFSSFQIERDSIFLQDDTLNHHGYEPPGVCKGTISSLERQVLRYVELNIDRAWMIPQKTEPSP
jgi:hypothetical protein